MNNPCFQDSTEINNAMSNALKAINNILVFMVFVSNNYRTNSLGMKVLAGLDMIFYVQFQ